jgi:hypothetical protein
LFLILKQKKLPYKIKKVRKRKRRGVKKMMFGEDTEYEVAATRDKKVE